jgi:hypothetical protein
LPVNVEDHLAAFVRGFVVAAKRDRWLELLTRRGRNAFRNSDKLMDALDGRFCVRADGVWDIDPGRLCVYYDFRDEPSVVPFGEATAAGTGRDALASLEPGRLAVHWSHEDWSWLCRR